MENTGLRGAGYRYDASSNTYTHPTRGPLERTGSITTRYDGQVIDGVDVSGNITVRHDNVTIRNCRVRYDGTDYAIDARLYKPSGTLIDHCDITTVGDRPHEAFGVYLANGTVRWSNIWRFQTGVFVNGDNARVEHNLVWDARRVSGTHGTGMSANNGGSNIVFKGNRINGNSSAALALYAQNPFHGVTVEDNLFDGGNNASFCLNAGSNKNGVSSNTDIRIRGNLFGRSAYPRCGEYGPYFNWGDSRPGAEWRDNRWRDTRDVVGDEAAGS